MNSGRTIKRVGWILLLALSSSHARAADAPAGWSAPDYGSAFWEHWGDGRAEIATYDLGFRRYGEERAGSAVAIFVTEPFSGSAAVKSDRSRGPDVLQVLKLNLMKDFPTGVYDYNTMLSAFVALENNAGAEAGRAAKIAFSSQEWCGQVYEQVRLGPDGVRFDRHSYFEGEADRTGSLPHPDDALSEDILPLWARGLAAPLLEPGERRTVSLLISLQRARLDHVDLGWRGAVLSRDESTTEVTVPAGTFEVSVYRASVEGGPEWTFHVESARPHRLVRWESSGGERAELVGSDRLSYWQMNANRDASALDRIGLKPRPPRTP